MIISVLWWAQYAFAAGRFDRTVQERYQGLALSLPLAILIVGVIGMGLANFTYVHAFISGRQPAGIALVILIRKKPLFGVLSEEKSHEKELFAEIKSLIFTNYKFTILLLYIDFFVMTNKICYSR